MVDADTTVQGRRAPRPGTFASLSNKAFRLYLCGQGVSLMGSWLQAAAVRWVVYERTRSETLLGVVETASLLPGVFVGLIAGILADRITPRRMVLLMECGQMALAFLLAVLVWCGVIEIWQLIVILALGRVCVTFELPSRQVFFYEMVGSEILPNAIALNSGMFNATRVIGQAVAGVLLLALGAAGCFLLNGMSFLAAIAAIAAIPVDDRAPHRKTALASRETLAGLGYLRQDRRMRAQFLVVALFGLVGMGYDAMLPAFAAKVLGSGVEGYSVLLAAGAIGATAGALLAARLGATDRKDRLTIGGIAIFAFFLGSAALLPWWTAPASQPARLAAASACLVGAGFGAVLLYSSSQMIIQLAVPDQLRGRVMGIWMIMFSSSVPLGALWTGRAAQSLGVTRVMAFSAVLCGLLALVAGAAGVLRPPPPEEIAAERRGVVHTRAAESPD